MLLATVIVGAFAGDWLKDRTGLFQRLKASKSPEAVAERAREFIRTAGYSEEPADTAMDLSLDADFVDFQISQKSGSFPFPPYKLSALSPVLFSYRESPQPLERSSFLEIRGGPLPLDPPLFFPGE